MPKGVYVKRRRDLAERFWDKVDVLDSDCCWEWQGYRDSRGYGTVGVGGREGGTEWAHRVAFSLTRGPIPKGLMVCHRCDNPPCCNPWHLFLGTALVNNRDAQAKGRNRKGENHPQAKLSDLVVAEIRSRYAEGGVSQSQLARLYGVTQSHISNIVTGRTRAVA
jgi:predicted XRE-type DNA-binding protein